MKALFLFTVQLAVTAVAAKAAISIGNINNFENLTTEGWGTGNPNPNPPFVQTVDDDDILLVTATGVGNAGSRMAVFTTDSTWTGDYLSAGVISLYVEMANADSSTDNLDMKLAVNGAGGWMMSNQTVTLIPDQEIGMHFTLYPSTVIHIGGGTGNVADTLSNVTKVWIFSATSGSPSVGTGGPIGDKIDAVLGIDSITAVPEPKAYGLIAGILAVATTLLWRRRAS